MDTTSRPFKLKCYLAVIQDAGLVLRIKKTSFAKPEVKFVGHIIGSGKHRPDPDKLSAVTEMIRPHTKSDVRKILGFFSYFRSYVPQFAQIAKVLTDLTQKDKPTKVIWTEIEEIAFRELKYRLCEECARIQLYIVDCSKPFGLLVDASGFTVGACLIQWDEQGGELPCSFASSKLNGSMLSWSTIEREAYGVIWALNKFRTWIFGAEITVFSDHNPLTYLTLNSPKSAKLTRWSLALFEFSVLWKYRKGKNHEVADCLSWVVVNHILRNRCSRRGKPNTFV